MTQDEIFEIAREAYENCDHIPDLKIPKEFVERFAKLIAEKEREACNAICLDTYEWAEKLLEKDEKHFAGRMRSAQDIGNAIRARGQE